MTPAEALVVVLSPAGFLPLVTLATLAVAGIDHLRRAARQHHTHPTTKGQ